MTFLIFSLLGVAISMVRYAVYIRAMVQRTTKPHPLTWLCSALMAGIALTVQYQGDAGPTIWVTGIVTLFCFGIGVAAIFYGEKRITRSDWISFGLALCAIPLWLITKQPILSMGLIVVIELSTYYPTVRKSYARPWDEDILSWSLSASRWILATLAVSNVTLATMFYPAFVAACETSIVLYFLWRRRVLGGNRAEQTHIVRPLNHP